MGIFRDSRTSREDSMTESGWRPIETAPRDGTPFLAWCEGTSPINGLKRSYWGLCHWDDKGRDVFVHYWDGDPAPDFPPLYWMPLPPPPEAK